MPFELKEPRGKGKSQYWTVRGTLNGRRIDRSTGQVSRKEAQAILDSWIERGELSDDRDVKSFAQACLDYIDDHQEQPRIAKLAAYFKNTPCDAIDNAAIKAAARALFPKGSAMTKNREVMTPVSAILKHAGYEFKVQRPEGWRGTPRGDWLEPEEAFRMFDAAETLDLEFAIFLITLTYTGMRLSEAWKGFKIDKLKFFQNGKGETVGYASVYQTKTKTWRGVHIPPAAAEALQRHPRGLDRPGAHVFRFGKKRLYALIKAVSEAANRPFQERQAFHLFRHTYGAWMRRFGGLDTSGLIATGTWKDAASVRVYEHAVASEEAQKADLLPVPKRKEA